MLILAIDRSNSSFYKVLLYFKKLIKRRNVGELVGVKMLKVNFA